MHPTQNQANPSVVTPAFTLRAAATYLQRHGWTTGDYYYNPENDLFPAACALGAIGMVVYGRQIPCPDDTGLAGFDDYDRTRCFLRDYLVRVGEIGPERDTTVGDWNDYPEQTLEAVATTLTAAADDWDRTHGGAR